MAWCRTWGLPLPSGPVGRQGASHWSQSYTLPLLRRSWHTSAADRRAVGNRGCHGVSLTCVRCTVNSDVTPLYVSGLAFLHLQMMATSMKAISDEPGGSLAGRISGSAGAPLAVFFHGLGGQRLSRDPQ